MQGPPSRHATGHPAPPQAGAGPCGAPADQRGAGCNLFRQGRGCTLESISPTDLEFLYLGYKNGGSFDERDIEGSELGKLGVGRVLDSIGLLKGRGLLVQNGDNSFGITDAARRLIWDNEMPLWARILRVLSIKPFTQASITEYLGAGKEEVSRQLELLRKNGLVMMSPLRTAAGLERMFEMLPPGLEELEKADAGNTDLIMEGASGDVNAVLDDIEGLVKGGLADGELRAALLARLGRIRSMLQDGAAS
ncbi:hypothetical protein CENSYa_1803 [Cenarchaeum symbiosum A]|uniref:Uncharacterized protein n=1 Tax=Cenarchaeum symbiosum (strain A) TaxID=414004 RepID=A0RYJ6_CENSY|nr:hypothetical protein CENSYa_1803 [Cenarchaeum symbiosum A]